MSLAKLLDSSGSTIDPQTLYTDLLLPQSSASRPYTVVNMVSTVDGKILVGPIGSTATGLGSPTDQMLMRRIQANVDAVVIGAGTLRPGNVVYDPSLYRIVVSRSGDLPLTNRFFTDAPDNVIILLPGAASVEQVNDLKKKYRVEQFGSEEVDLRSAVKWLHTNLEIRKLAVEGGADLNFQFLNLGLVDEFFLTLSPKIKGGREMPTTVEGVGFHDWDYLNMELITLYHDHSELYFRYRVLDRQIK